MTPTATLALVLVLYSADATSWQETAPVDMPAADCLEAMAAIYQAPMPTVALDEQGRPIPAIDAYCVATEESK